MACRAVKGLAASPEWCILVPSVCPKFPIMSLTLREAARLSGRVVYLEIITLCLSLFSLVALVAEVTLPLAPAERELLQYVDTLICGIFLTDFLVHWYLAPNKRVFWKWGWIDLVSSIPELAFLRWGRVFRIVRIVRALRSFNEVAEHFAFDRAKGTFAIVSLASVMATLFATVAVLAVETTSEANIRTAGDALWWAFATVTTIGYGDRYPVTVAGRLVAVVLVVFGVSFFGTFTAYLASFFVGKEQKREETEIHRLTHEVRKLREQIEQFAGPQSASPASVPHLAPPPVSHENKSSD